MKNNSSLGPHGDTGRSRAVSKAKSPLFHKRSAGRKAAKSNKSYQNSEVKNG